MTYILTASGGQQRYLQGVLVSVGDDPPLERIADRFPTLVVLIKDMSSFNIAVFLNYQQGALST